MTLEAYPELMRTLLANRGIHTGEEAEVFLNPEYNAGTHDPYLLKDMTKAVVRIQKAMENNETIGIYSDYDADGIPGAVILNDTIKKLGYTNFIVYIPHRHDEGFGLNIKAIDELAAKGVKLLITIDCGVADIEEAAYAKSLGVDLIITDHHLSHETLPDAYAIINPKQPGCEYPFKELCGSGVIYKVAQALLSHPSCADKVKPGQEKWLLDMVGIATLSDMVSLRGENRVLARYGLLVLRKSPRIGLQMLLKEVGANQLLLTEDDIGFSVTPRINAASRMGSPEDAFKLLATEDEAEAERLVDHLTHLNNERKGIVASIVKELRKSVDERYPDEKKVIVMGNPSWRPSLLGLAANVFADEFSCPVFLWGRDGENVIKGSCRTGGGANLVKLMQAAVPGTFLEFGGHAGSGGFSVSNEKIHELEASLLASFELSRAERATVAEAVISFDAELSLDEVHTETSNIIETLAPYGEGNPKPIFKFPRVMIEGVKVFGKEKNHLELTFMNSRGRIIPAISFFSTPESWGSTLEKGRTVDLFAHIEKSSFRGRSEIRLRIVEVK